MKFMILSHNERLGIDKNKESFKDIAKKHEEESEELKEELERGNKFKIAEETLDQMQICIGILDKLATEGMDIEQLVKRHNKKLLMREWKDKGVVIIKWIMSV